MTTTTRCDCCDLPVESCGRAVEDRQRNAGRAERRRLVNLPGAFLARYAGQCVRCDDWYAAGDPIVRDGASYRSLTCCESA